MRSKYLISAIFIALSPSLFSINSSGDKALAESSRQNQSEWVFRNDRGKLTYKTTSRGDRIMDFSHAGYMGGGVSHTDSSGETVCKTIRKRS